MHKLRHLEIASTGNIVKLDHTHTQGQDVPSDDADEDRSQAENPLSKVGEERNDDQRKSRYDPVLPAAIGRRTNAACHIVDGNRIKG